MLAALDALIQNGPEGRGAMVLRQLCALFLKVGVDGEASTAGLFDEVMANVAADLDDETVLFLAPELGHMASVLPAFASTISSRSHEIRARSIPESPFEPPAESAADNVSALDPTNLPHEGLVAEPHLEADHAPDTVSAAATMLDDVSFAPPAIAVDQPAPQPTQDRRTTPRDPEADAANPITLARRASPLELLQIAALPNLPDSITNVLIARGDRDALQRALRNPTAQFSRSSLTTLAELAPSDRMIKEGLLARTDLPEPILERLLPFLLADAKARALMAGAPFDVQQACDALRQASTDLDTAYRQGQMVVSLDGCNALLEEGKMSVNDVITLLARDMRLAELADFAATQLGIQQVTAFNILSGRLDHGAAVIVRALNGDSDSMDAVMTMRRRCGCRDAKETRSAFSTGQSYSVETALSLIRQMDQVEPVAETKPRSTADGSDHHSEGNLLRFAA